MMILRMPSMHIISSMAAIKKHRGIFSVLFVAYLVLLFYFLFFSEGFGRMQGADEYHYNLVLFREIRRFTKYRHIVGNRAFLLNVFGNLIAFMPLGFFIPALSRKSKNGFAVVLNCFLVSLLVEVIQLVFKLGCFDVDDLLLNTLGGLLGYMIYWICDKITDRTSRQKG